MSHTSSATTPQQTHTTARRRNAGQRAALVFCLCVGGGALLFLLLRDPALLAWSRAWPALVRPLGVMLLSLAAGLAAGLAIEGGGWAPMLARVASPVMRWGRLPEACGAAFTTAFLSAAAANALLMEAYRDGRLTLREMRLGYLMGTGIPVFLLHLPTTFFIVTPLARGAGVTYLAINGVAALLRTVGVLFATRLTSTPESPDDPKLASPGPASPGQASPAQGTRTRSLRPFSERFRMRLTRLVLFTAPTYLLMYALHQGGVFDALRNATAHWLADGLLPVEAAGVLVFSVASEFSSGVAAAGALLAAGSLTTQETVLALIIGGIIATPLRAIRHQFPAHAGIFTPTLGLSLLVQSQLLRIASVVVVTAAWLAFI